MFYKISLKVKTFQVKSMSFLFIYMCKVTVSGKLFSHREAISNVNLSKYSLIKKVKWKKNTCLVVFELTVELSNYCFI